MKFSQKKLLKKSVITKFNRFAAVLFKDADKLLELPDDLTHGDIVGASIVGLELLEGFVHFNTIGKFLVFMIIDALKFIHPVYLVILPVVTKLLTLTVRFVDQSLKLLPWIYIDKYLPYLSKNKK